MRVRGFNSPQHSFSDICIEEAGENGLKFSKAKGCKSWSQGSTRTLRVLDNQHSSILYNK